MQGDLCMLHELSAKARSKSSEDTEDKGQHAFSLHSFTCRESFPGIDSSLIQVTSSAALQRI